jgi:hypothetical protein
VTNPFDPAQNILAGARYLRQLLDRYGGDVKLALAAYNAGPGAVDLFGGVPPYRETQTYIRKVFEALNEPPPPEVAAPALEPPTENRPRTYTVRPGDTLWDIAAEHLGDPLRWVEIAVKNNIDPSEPLIHPGQKLRLE